MPSSTGRSGDVKCPFFRSLDYLSVNCEPPMDSAFAVRLRFKSRHGYDFHFFEYCCNNFKYCELYQMTYQAKYED